jgi:alpha-glucoside transport system permease protein
MDSDRRRNNGRTKENLPSAKEDFLNSIGTSIPALIVIGAVLIPLAIYCALGVGERLMARLLPRGANHWRPILWLAAPLAIVGVILVYPLAVTLFYAFGNATATGWVGFRNFTWSFEDDMVGVMANSLLWLIVLPIGCVILSLVAAVLFDKVKYERLAITIILLPTAISFTAASIVWRQLFSFQPRGSTQLGLLNALWTLIPGRMPIPWLQAPYINSFCLIFVALWASLGVATLIISAAVKNVPVEIGEAARLDGAGPWRILFSITLPSIVPAILVVLTTEAIFALKVFDIVFVMTNGNFDTDVVANRMYAELFTAGNLGHASAIAVILLIAALPVVFINVRQFRDKVAR